MLGTFCSGALHLLSPLLTGQPPVADVHVSTEGIPAASEGEAEAPGASHASFLTVGEHAHTSNAKYSVSLSFNESL